MPLEVVLIIIRELGTILASLKINLNKLEAEVALGLMQMSVLVETAYTERKAMDF